MKISRRIFLPGQHFAFPLYLSHKIVNTPLRVIHINISLVIHRYISQVINSYISLVINSYISLTFSLTFSLNILQFSAQTLAKQQGRYRQRCPPEMPLAWPGAMVMPMADTWPTGALESIQYLCGNYATVNDVVQLGDPNNMMFQNSKIFCAMSGAISREAWEAWIQDQNLIVSIVTFSLAIRIIATDGNSHVSIVIFSPDISQVVNVIMLHYFSIRLY